MTYELAITRENCDYRGEGNLNVIIMLKKEEKILRLPKQENEFMVKKVPIKDVHRKLENQVEVTKNVLIPLLGEEIVHCPNIIPMKAEDIKMINNLCNHLRPAHRLHKNLQEEDTYVLLLPDYCSLPLSLNYYCSTGPTIAVEIKVKQGFMLSTQEAQLQCKPAQCLFCMKQYLKIRNGWSSQRSGYCPLDLFSGCHVKMLHALKSLLEVPQNNFRIFKDQKLVFSEEEKGNLDDILSSFFSFPEEKNYLETFCNLIIKGLLSSFSSNSYKWANVRNRSISCANKHEGCQENGLCQHELPFGCVLNQILNVQLLDNMDIVELYSLFLEFKEFDQESQSNYIGCLPRSQIPTFMGELNKSKAETRSQFISRKIWEFILALTLRDCSIMLVFKHLETKLSELKKNVIVDDHGNYYLFSIALADLDNKSVNTVEQVFHKTKKSYRYLH